jgi:hypothetical protein
MAMPIEPERLSGTFVELADSLVTGFDVTSSSTGSPRAAPNCST